MDGGRSMGDGAVLIDDRVKWGLEKKRMEAASDGKEYN
jgi:hypothetical protein